MNKHYITVSMWNKYHNANHSANDGKKCLCNLKTKFILFHSDLIKSIPCIINTLVHG